MTELLAILAGIGLAAACGFRVFLPLFIASLAVQTGVAGFGGFSLASLIGDDISWLGTPTATIAFGVATLLEIGAYYIPWVDNALDTVATPAAVIAGTLVSYAFLPGTMDDGMTQWVAAAIMGGGTAGLIQAGTVAIRGTSSATTGGLGNFVVSSFEAIAAIIAGILSIFLPLLAGILALILGIFMIRRIIQFRRWIRTK